MSRLILVADDDANDRLLIGAAIAQVASKCHVRFVDDGEQLLDYLMKRGEYSDPSLAPRPHLILLDLNARRINGLEALGEIKSRSDLRTIPVVVITRAHSPESVRQSYDAGANSFITKPIDFSELVQLMERICTYWFGTVELPMNGTYNTYRPSGAVLD